LAFLLVRPSFFTVTMARPPKDSKEPEDYKDIVDYILMKADKSMLKGLAYAVWNGHITEKECYEALPNKLNYEESMFFKDCTMDAINEIASAELQKLAAVSDKAVEDLDSEEAIAIRNKRDKNLDDAVKFQLRKTNGYDYEGKPRPKEKVYDSELLPPNHNDDKPKAKTKKLGFHIAFDGNTWACDPNGPSPSFTAMPPSEAKNTFVIQIPETNTYYVVSPNDNSAVNLPSLNDDNETHHDLARTALAFYARQPPGAGLISYDPVASPIPATNTPRPAGPKTTGLTSDTASPAKRTRFAEEFDANANVGDVDEECTVVDPPPPSPHQQSRPSNPSPGSFNSPSPRQPSRPSNRSPGSFNNPSPRQEPRPSNPSPGSFNNPFINGSNNAQRHRRSTVNILSSIRDREPAILIVENIVMPHWRRMKQRAEHEPSRDGMFQEFEIEFDHLAKTCGRIHRVGAIREFAYKFMYYFDTVFTDDEMDKLYQKLGGYTVGGECLADVVFGDGWIGPTRGW
jgi:hypothetical protein